MKHPDELDRVLRGLVPAPPPPEVRERVLTAARAARTSGPLGRDLWSRIWESRPLRLAWAATVVVLLVANVVLALHRPGGGAATAPVAAARHDGPDPELAAIAQLPPLRLDVLPSFDRSRRSLPSANPAKPS